MSYNIYHDASVRLVTPYCQARLYKCKDVLHLQKARIWLNQVSIYEVKKEEGQ